MRIPDWLIYALALSVFVWAIFLADNEALDAPEPLPENLQEEGPSLPEPTVFDETVLVQVAAPQDGVGSAFAIDRNGNWLTARHVVDGCRRVSLLVAPNRYVSVAQVDIDPASDLALLQTGRSLRAVDLKLENDLRVGQIGYHVGYPQGRPGEVATRLLARSRLVTRGTRRGEEPVLAWSELGRTRGLTGSLGGLSGGPVFDAEGRARGVIVAESPRRGRIYTAAPRSIERFLERRGISPSDGRAEPITVETYGRRADDLRKSLQVVKVACEVDR
ncbi:MAG: serine protease [Pseudomonadota bacterium]